MDKEDYKRLLIKEYRSLFYWSPDYEEIGFQCGPSKEEIDEVVKKIKKLDKNWLTIEEEQSKCRNDKLEFLTESYLEQAFPEFYENLDKLEDHSRKFIKQHQRSNLKDMTVKQRKWVLSLVSRHGSKSTAETLWEYLNEE